jgi:flagellar motor component MotA
MTFAALTILGWIIVIGLVGAVIGTIVYYVRPKPSAEKLEEHAQMEAERRRDPDPPGWSPH